MTASEINYSALKHFSTLFRTYRWLKRIRMILFRVLLLVALIVLAYVAKRNNGEISYESSSNSTVSFNFNPLWILVFWFFLNVILLMYMNKFWKQFAVDNNGFRFMQPKMSPDDHSVTMGGALMPQMTIPSFKGKKMRMSLFPITGRLNDTHFGIFTRMYKEGGLIRWRERQMDTIIWLDLPKTLPDIVIDATANQRARRSNLSKHFDAAWKFQFEGTHGTHYNVYVDPVSRVTALQLFTPDVLDVLYSRMPDMDIEISGTTIWFIKRYGILDDRLAAEMFSAVEALSPELFHQIQTASV